MENNILELIKSKVEDKKIKQSFIEQIFGDNNIDESEYAELVENFLKEGIEVVDDEDIILPVVEEDEIDVIEESIEEEEEIEDVEEYIKHENLGIEAEDIIKQYFNDISQYPVLSYEEELELVAKAKKGDESAHESLVTSNLRLVVKTAIRYIKPGFIFLDLVQDGTIGLITAINKFDPERGYRLSTYATWWIKKSIIDSLKEKINFIKIPNYIYLNYKKIIAFEREFYNKNNRRPTQKEIEEHMKMTWEEIDKVKTIVESKMITINGQNQDGKEDEYEIPDNSTEEEIDLALENMHSKLRLSNMLQKISKREREIIELYFGMNDEGRKYTFKEIGGIFNLSSERVRIIKERAIKKLRFIGKKEI